MTPDEIQTTWDWLVPVTKDHLRPDEAARFLGRELDFVYAMIEEGKLEAFEPPDRIVKRKTITRRSVVALLAEMATVSPELFADRCIALLQHADSALLTRLITEATKLRTQRLNKL